jgi:hypothetical protein
MNRIVSLPISDPVTPEEIEALSREVLQAAPFEGACDMPGCKTCDTPLRLFSEQAADLRAFRTYGCGFWANKVGSGKSTTAMLIAQEAFALDPDTRVLLLVPASVVRQFFKRDIPWGRKHLTHPKGANLVRWWYDLQGMDANHRRAVARAKKPGVYVLPYSQLSQEDARVILELVDAELVIADECQHLRGDNAKQRRFWEWVESRDEPPIGVGMSGTVQTASPSDYHRTIRWCLGDLSPLPRTVMESQHWSAILRATADRCPDWCPGPGSSACSHRDMDPEQYARMLPLLEFARKNFPTEQDHGEDCPRPPEGCRCPKAAQGTSIRAARAAYKLRFRSCPGVVPMSDDALGVGLEISNLPCPMPNAQTQELMDAVKRDWISPDGRILTYGLEQHQVLSQLTCGFWIRHYWPEAHPKLREVQRAYRLREDYHKLLRPFFSSAISRKLELDTPRQVGRWHADKGSTHGAFDHLYEAWTDWKEIDRRLEPSEKPEKVMLSELVMVDTFKVDLAVAWARKHREGIIWCEHTLFADVVHAALVNAALKRVNVLRKAQGASWLRSDGSHGSICVANRKAHHEGKNLQDHQHQLFLQWCRPQSHMEQLLGRVHRIGQKAERLVVHTARVTEFDHMTVCATLWDTVYDKQTQGGSKKLLFADWDPLPVEYPPDFLRERGFRLSANESEEDEDGD